MVQKKHIILCILLCVLLAGCGAEASPPPEAYHQMALYVQEGLRRYEIEGGYTASFGPIEEYAGHYYTCSILLEGESGLWREDIAYTYDEDTGWYTFSGQYEPILTHDAGRTLDEDNAFVQELRESACWQIPLSKETDLAIPIRCTSESGPVERTEYIYSPFTAESINLYSYLDDRLDTYVEILYPKIYISGDEPLAERINEQIQAAFFYGYYPNQDSRLDPGETPYTNIQRHYLITRDDDRYLSIRIYEDNYTRYANHPNEWETGLTIDKQTGERLLLSDVAGGQWTLEALLDSGAFECLWTFADSFSEQDIFDFAQSGGATLDDYNAYFYLTGDSLGLIVEVARYYTCMEAKLTDLGLSEYAG